MDRAGRDDCLPAPAAEERRTGGAEEQERRRQRSRSKHKTTHNRSLPIPPSHEPAVGHSDGRSRNGHTESPVRSAAQVPPSSRARSPCRLRQTLVSRRKRPCAQNTVRAARSFRLLPLTPLSARPTSRPVSHQPAPTPAKTYHFVVDCISDWAAGRTLHLVCAPTALRPTGPRGLSGRHATGQHASACAPASSTSGAPRLAAGETVILLHPLYL